jgi:F-type H+-transporting ATPase subunit epsilon
MQCLIITPEQTVCDTKTEFVALTLTDGEIGVAPGHTPFVGRLGSGELRIGHGGGAGHYYVEGGFVEVVNDVVSVLTTHALPAQELDEAVVSEQISAAQSRPANTPELAEARQRAVERGRAQLRTLRRASGERD